MRETVWLNSSFTFGAITQVMDASSVLTKRNQLHFCGLPGVKSPPEPRVIEMEAELPPGVEAEQ
jgi:hypothetical protein